METGKVIKGIARAKGHAAGEALVSPVRMGWEEKANFATNRFKEIKLFSALSGGWMFGAVPDLIDAAVTGRFVSRRW